MTVVHSISSLSNTWYFHSLKINLWNENLLFFKEWSPYHGSFWRRYAPKKIKTHFRRAEPHGLSYHLFRGKNINSKVTGIWLRRIYADFVHYSHHFPLEVQLYKKEKNDISWFTHFMWLYPVPSNRQLPTAWVLLFQVSIRRIFHMCLIIHLSKSI